MELRKICFNIDLQYNILCLDSIMNLASSYVFMFLYSWHDQLVVYPETNKEERKRLNRLNRNRQYGVTPPVSFFPSFCCVCGFALINMQVFLDWASEVVWLM